MHSISTSKLVKILRAKPESLLEFDQKMAALIGKTGVLEKIAEENDKTVDLILKNLNLTRQSPAREIYEKLVETVKQMDAKLYDFLDKPDLLGNSKKLLTTARELTNPAPGFFIKKVKAAQML